MDLLLKGLIDTLTSSVENQQLTLDKQEESIVQLKTDLMKANLELADQKQATEEAKKESENLADLKFQAFSDKVSRAIADDKVKALIQPLLDSAMKAKESKQAASDWTRVSAKIKDSSF